MSYQSVNLERKHDLKQKMRMLRIRTYRLKLLSMFSMTPQEIDPKALEIANCVMSGLCSYGKCEACTQDQHKICLAAMRKKFIRRWYTRIDPIANYVLGILAFGRELQAEGFSGSNPIDRKTERR